MFGLGKGKGSQSSLSRRLFGASGSKAVEKPEDVKALEALVGKSSEEIAKAVELWLARKDLTSIPAIVTSLTHLQRLNISFNK